MTIAIESPGANAAALKAALEAALTAATLEGPLLIYGGTGLGTTALLSALLSTPTTAFGTHNGVSLTINSLNTAPEGYFTAYPSFTGAVVDLTDDTPGGFVYGSASIVNVIGAKGLDSIVGGDLEAWHKGSGTVIDVFGSYCTAGMSNDAGGAVTRICASYNYLPLFGGTVANAYGLYLQVDGGATITNLYGVWLLDMAPVAATNRYYSWFDSRGVRRVKEDASYDSVGQAIEALYNPQFTKYTPGAVNYERIVLGQWNGNVAEIGAEKGGTGTLRPLRLIGDHLIFPTYYEMAEMTAPAAPAANGARVYSEDDGGGRTRVMVKFSSGAAQQIAIQP